MSKKRRRKHALARRYGHFNMADIGRAGGKASATIKRFTHDNPMVAGAAMGATASAITAGTPPATAAVVGALAGIAAQAATK